LKMDDISGNLMSGVHFQNIFYQE
jgi:hypothetical protein